MKKLISILLLLSFLSTTVQSSVHHNTQKMLEALDSVLANRHQYEQIKQQQLSKSRQRLSSLSQNKEKEYQILGDLISQYLRYNTDSCKRCIDRRLKIAHELKNPAYITEVNLNLAEWYKNTGMYGQAYELLKTQRKQLPADLTPYYYMIFLSYYTMLEEYVPTKEFKEQYFRLGIMYRDSLIQISQPGELQSLLAKADNMRLSNQPQDAIKIMKAELAKMKKGNPDIRLVGVNLAQCYALTGDTEKAKYYFALSAISDAEHCVKENMSLRMLAVILYKEGELKRANTYLQHCIRDAVDCKARLREVEAAMQIPTIVKAYQNIIEKKNKSLMTENWSLFLLIIILGTTAYYIVKQNHKLKQARRNTITVNQSLEKANEQLNDAVTALQQLNKELSENNCIKDEYIVQYLNLSSLYLNRMEEYRHTLIKTGGEGKIDKLLKELRSTQFLEKQLKEFYINFDHSFLKIFPAFIEEFNAMLLPEEKISLKSDGQMPTEMRIFALIQLGITDSTYLAQMLHCSVQTIYNYRSKIRTKLRDRNVDFEHRLRTIGSIVSQ